MGVFDPTQTSPTSNIGGITNGTFNDLIANGEAGEIAQTVVDTISTTGGELGPIIDDPEYYIPIKDGSINFVHYERAGEGFVNAPVTSTTAIQKTVPAGPIEQYNSNLSTVQRGQITQVYNANVANDTVTLSTVPKNGGTLGSKALYFLGEVNQAVAAAQVGIMLGKTIDSALYNINPDFWDSNGMSAINPETWGSITHGDESLGATLFNLIFGIDPDTGIGQAYLEKDAAAIIAMFMQQMGIFSTGGASSSYDATVLNVLNKKNWPNPLNTTGSVVQFTLYVPAAGEDINTVITSTAPYTYTFFYNNTATVVGVSSSPFTINIIRYRQNGTIYYQETRNSISAYLGNPITSRISNTPINISTYSFGYPTMLPNWIPYSFTLDLNSYRDIGTIIYDGTTTQYGPVDGIGNQDGATLPDTSNWDTVPNTASSLAQQYPNTFGSPITYDQIQPDGTTKEVEYIPVGFPSTFPNPWTDTQPVTTSQQTTQAQPQIDISTLTSTDTSPLTKTLTQSPTSNPNPSDTVPQNPSDTGTGDTASPILPVGSASALWSVYHPTQAQVNAFGAWLWSSPFETNIGKLFQNPIEGVISLHKVFAPPVDSGTQNIVVGTLDSGVSSATVNQQYVTVDCGLIDCYEDFGNVFDYPPFTSVSIYLPFIGIMPLDANDVMRSTVHVVYGVDIFTGACLAMVEVSRDGNTVNMYQYSGVCSASYPITNIQYSQTLTGILAITSGMAMGGLAGAMTIAGGALSTAKGTVGRSSNFSGNAGAMGIKTPYLILQRPQTKVADNFPSLAGYPTNVSGKLSQFGGQVRVTDVHVEGINATQSELAQIEDLLKSGILISD